METSPKSEIKFYQSLGKLFYAIAASDKIVRKVEVETLKKIVSSQWTPLDKFEDEFHTDAAYQIEIVFDWLNYKHLNSEICFNDFKLFKREHKSKFSEKRKQLIWKTANVIANSFSGKNKSELIMIAKLKMVLEEK